MKLIFICMLIFIPALSCCAQGQPGVDSAKVLIRTIRSFKKADKAATEAANFQSAADSAKFIIAATAKFDSVKYSFVNRRGCYSLSTGYKNALGAAGIKFEDRIHGINSHFQFGFGFGYSTFLGLKVAGGGNYFFVSEKEKFMPLIGVEYVAGTGNQLSNKDDKFYCTIGSHQYVNASVGLKIKPWSKLHYHVNDRLTFNDFWDLKIIAGYSFLVSALKIDTVAGPPGNWSYPLKTIKHFVESGFFVAINFGVDVPYIREKNFKNHIRQKEINKSN